MKGSAFATWVTAAGLAAALSACTDTHPVNETPSRPEQRVEAAAPHPTAQPTVSVAIAGRMFTLEVAGDQRTQTRGLGGRTFIDAHGGMLFAYRKSRELAMVMRDCPIAIDVAFLDEEGRVLALHAMRPELPRQPSESHFQYEARLPAYSSGAPARFAVEVAGGRLLELGVAVGDRLVAPWRKILE